MQFQRQVFSCTLMNAHLNKKIYYAQNYDIVVDKLYESHAPWHQVFFPNNNSYCVVSLWQNSNNIIIIIMKKQTWA